MKLEEDKNRLSFPEWTVYLFEEDGDIKNMHTSEYFVQMGKSYEQCTNAMNKHESKKWKERQDKDLYQVTRILELEREQHRKISKNDIAERLSEIKYDIDRLLDDIEG